MKKRSKTYGQGVADERTTWVNKLKRDYRRKGGCPAVKLYQATLIDWALEKAERARKRKGGIGSR